MTKDINRNGIGDRRAASPRRDSDVKIAKWPVITKGAYQSMLARTKDGATDVNQKTRSLCLARIKLGHALLALDKALIDHNPRKDGRGPLSNNVQDADRPIYNRLVGIRSKIEREIMRYPLEVA